MTWIVPSQQLFGQILLPPPPSALPPPTTPIEKNPAVIRKQERELKKAEENQKNETATQEKRKQKELEDAKAEAQQKRPLYGFFELSLLKPTALVSNSRSNYICDVTSHISGYLRMFVDKDPDVVQGFAGMRVAPFGGYGTQNKLTARFAHMFIGPAIGIGRIGAPDDPLDDSPTRFMWLWSGGIAGLTRLANKDESYKGAPSDFKSSRWIYESPGMWSELRWTRIVRGAVGYGAMVGTQAGSGKTFYYAGITASGFY